MILVTGGTGLLGGFVVRELQSRGLAVRVLAWPGSLDVARAMGVEVFPGNLSDAESLRQAMRNVSGVIHACGGYQRSSAAKIQGIAMV